MKKNPVKTYKFIQIFMAKLNCTLLHPNKQYLCRTLQYAPLEMAAYETLLQSLYVNGLHFNFKQGPAQ